MKKNSKSTSADEKNNELTNDLKRVRADFENYRKRVDIEKSQVSEIAKNSTILKILPLIDDIERATANIPKEIESNSWVKGITSMARNLEKNLSELGVQKINSKSGTEFNPEFHEAVMFDDKASGEKEVVSEELRSGYMLEGVVIRPAMVKVTKK